MLIVNTWMHVLKMLFYSSWESVTGMSVFYDTSLEHSTSLVISLVCISV